VSTGGGVTLDRGLGFWALVSYGLGDILGAGIYALMGKVAGVAGAHAWLGFGVSLLAASITALTYSELVNRFPRSGGEAFYAERGFGMPLVSSVTGWLVFCAGTLSLAAIAVVFAGYLESWLPAVPGPLVIVAFILALGFVNFRGIRESSMANIVCTVIEASGLVLVIVVGGAHLMGGGVGATGPPPATNPLALDGADPERVMQAAALAFFAFIGFQDMVNVAEEVEAPERNFPAAILTALGVAGIIYVAVAIIATAVVDPRVLGASSAPLTEVVEVAGGGGLARVFPVVALFAVANTGLLNFIMASRLLYGMAGQGLVPSPLARVHAGRRTPHLAILTVLTAALVLALSGTLGYLAGATSTLLLVVFLVVNLALVMVKRRDGAGDRPGFRVPAAVPLLGVFVTAAVMGFAEPTVLMTTAGLAAVGAGLYGIRRASGARP
jgi:amino acid transporter